MTGTEHDVAHHWESTADAWIAWTRTPGHDLFWSYRDGFRAFLPPPGDATLEVGCGEGRISRELTDLGHDVTAVDLLEPRPDRAEGRPWDRFPLFCWIVARRC